MSFHTGQTFTFGEQPSATKWQWVWDNDYALQDWSAFTNDTFPIALIQDGDLTAAKLDADAIGHGFLEIGRTTLGSVADSISVASLPARKYLRVLVHVINSGSINGQFRFNNDSGNNYAYRVSTNGGAETTLGSTSGGPIGDAGSGSNKISVAIDIVNIENQEKLVFGQLLSNNGNGAANIPERRIGGFKWANTSAQINRIDYVNVSTGDYAAGSEMVVLGKD